MDKCLYHGVRQFLSVKIAHSEFHKFICSDAVILILFQDEMLVVGFTDVSRNFCF